MSDLKDRTIQLTISERCNLNCIYCYEHNKDVKTMPLEVAKKVISNEFQYAEKNNIEFLNIYIHGGEVCLEFELLKNICEWIWSKEWPIRYICNTTTNGTLVHGDIKDWFKSNANRIMLTLSLDGNKIMHNINRSKSYDLIDVDFFKETFPNVEVKMTISPLTLPYLYDGVIAIAQQGLCFSANLAYGCEWENESLKRTYADQLFRLSKFFLDNPQLTPPNKLLYDDWVIFGSVLTHKPNRPLQRSCGVGYRMCCYDMDGRKYPCQMFMPSSNNVRLIKHHLDDSDICISEECNNCSIRHICQMCLGFNYISKQKIGYFPNNLCDYRKLEAYNMSYFMFNLLQNRKKYPVVQSLTDIETALILKAIIFIQTELKNDDIVRYIN